MNAPSLSDILQSKHPFLFVVVSDRKEAEEKVKTFFEKEKEEDVELFLYSTKQVTLPLARDVRSLSTSQGQKKKIIVLSFYIFLHDAQNALLKALEEVGENARFIFLAESKEGILPTIFSRCALYDLREGEMKKQHFDIVLFLGTTPSLRMEIPFVKALLAKKDDDDKKDRELFSSFLDELFMALPKTKGGQKGREDILTFLPYTRDTGSSSKMILEYLALSLPLVLE